MSTTNEQPVWASAKRPVLASDWTRDGNAFALLGQAMRAQQKAGWTKEQRDAWHEFATEADYDHLLRAIIAWHDEASDDEWDDDDEDGGW
jgi:hypothetical protein